MIINKVMKIMLMTMVMMVLVIHTVQELLPYRSTSVTLSVLQNVGSYLKTIPKDVN